jgi:DNA-binding transcriptional LysR family regulator
LLRQEGCLVAHAQHPLVRKPRVQLADLSAFTWLLPAEGTPTRAAINSVFARASLAAPVATVEASSTKVIHLTLRANPRMLSIVPSDAGQDIQKLGGVRRLPFPVPLQMPSIGLISATRHRDTPLVRNLRNILQQIVRNRREAS